MFNNARISKIEGLVQQLDEDIDELDQEVESLAGLAHRVEETEVNQEAYRLASLATAEGAALLLDLVSHLYGRIVELEVRLGIPGVNPIPASLLIAQRRERERAGRNID